jgi:hypothetical protein
MWDPQHLKTLQASTACYLFQLNCSQFPSGVPLFSLSSLHRQTSIIKKTNILLQRANGNLTGKYGVMHHIPRTTSLTGDDVRASWVVKSEAVTWHSHSPSSNSSVAALTHRLQSPVSWLPAHSYFLVYIPTGCNTRTLHYNPLSFVFRSESDTCLSHFRSSPRSLTLLEEKENITTASIRGL